MAGLLVVVYLTVWSEARRAIMVHAAAPILHAAAADHPHASVSANAGSGAVAVTVRAGEDASGETRRATLVAPAGVQFLLPALFLVLIAPGRLDWLYFGAGHLGLSALAVAAGAVMIGAPGYGAPVVAFVQSYLVDAYSLAVPALVYVRHRSRRATAGG
jgi:hypothetical protein